MGLLLNGAEALVIKDMEVAKVLNATFTLFLLIKLVHVNPRSPRPGRRSGARQDLPLAEENWVRKHSNKLAVHKSTVPGGMPQVPCGVLGPVLGS